MTIKGKMFQIIITFATMIMRTSKYDMSVGPTN